MLIVIDLYESRVHLSEPDDFTRFAVAVEGSGDQNALAQVVDQSGVGRLGEDGQHLVVDPDSLRAIAGPRATEAWDEGFAGMCAYAAGKGWVDADGGILAHIEPRGAAG